MTVKTYAKVIKDINPGVFDQLRRRLEDGKHQVNVGFPGGIDHEDSGFTVAQIAAVHEFGAPSAGIPERPFLRTAIDQNRAAYVALNRQSLASVLKGDMTIDNALGLLGEKAKGDVQKEITNGSFESLSEATIRRKGSTKPLIDSGQMRQSVAWELEK